MASTPLQQTQAAICQLPNEILPYFLQHCRLEDIFAVSATCKELYLRVLDSATLRSEPHSPPPPCNPSDSDMASPSPLRRPASGDGGQRAPATEPAFKIVEHALAHLRQGFLRGTGNMRGQHDIVELHPLRNVLWYCQHITFSVVLWCRVWVKLCRHLHFFGSSRSCIYSKGMRTTAMVCRAR